MMVVLRFQTSIIGEESLPTLATDAVEVVGEILVLAFYTL